MHYTLRDISDLIATVENRLEEPVFNQLKGLAGRGILQSVPDSYGRKGALLFPENEVFCARLLLAALDNGFASDKLARFDAQMRSESLDMDVTTGKRLSFSFHDAVADLRSAVANPEHAKFWVFEVGRVRMDGELGFSGYWIVDGKRRSIDPDCSLPRSGFEGVTTFAFTNLMAPLIAAMQAEG